MKAVFHWCPVNPQKTYTIARSHIKKIETMQDIKPTIKTIRKKTNQTGELEDCT